MPRGQSRRGRQQGYARRKAFHCMLVSVFLDLSIRLFSSPLIVTLDCRDSGLAQGPLLQPGQDWPGLWCKKKSFNGEARLADLPDINVQLRRLEIYFSALVSFGSGFPFRSAFRNFLHVMLRHAVSTLTRGALLANCRTIAPPCITACPTNNFLPLSRGLHNPPGRIWTVYLSGEIHSDWRGVIAKGIQVLFLSLHPSFDCMV